MRAKLKSNTDDQLNSNEMMVKLASLWKNLPKTEREAYYTEARDDKLRYLRELDNFSKNHPSESIHNRTKKNHIKKPCSAYAIFLREKKGVIKEDKPDLKMADILKIVSEQWKNLSDEDRIIYKDKAQEEKETVRIKLGESMDKAKNNAPKANPSNAKKIKTQEQSSEHPLNLIANTKVPTKVGTTRDLKLKLDNADLLNRSFDRTFSAMASFRNSEPVAPKPFWEEPSISLASLLRFSVPDLKSNSAKEPELDEGAKSLMKLFDKAVQKSNELIVELLNFNLPNERFDTLNLNPKSPVQPDLSLLIPQLLLPFEGMNFSSTPNLNMPSLKGATDENAAKSAKKQDESNSDSKEPAPADLQMGNLSPPKVS